MAFDLKSAIADHFDFFHGTESITYVERRISSGAADNTSYRDIPALPRELSKSDMLLLSEPEAPMLVWHIKKSELGDHNITPRQGDEIHQCDPAGTKWSIISIKIQTLGTRYRFICTKGES